LNQWKERLNKKYDNEMIQMKTKMDKWKEQMEKDILQTLHSQKGHSVHQIEK
jgi:hypothetical protein